MHDKNRDKRVTHFDVLSLHYIERVPVCRVVLISTLGLDPSSRGCGDGHRSRERHGEPGRGGSVTCTRDLGT